MTNRKQSKRSPAKGGGREEISITGLAQRLGVARKTVTSHIERGTLPPDCIELGTNGRVITDAARAEACVREAMARKPSPQLPSRDPVSIPDGVNPEDPETWPLEIEALKVIREYWCARQTNLKTELASGELVRADEVRREAFRAARMARDMLLAIPDQVGDDLAAELGVSDRAAVKRVILSRVERALGDFAKAINADGGGG